MDTETVASPQIPTTDDEVSFFDLYFPPITTISMVNLLKGFQSSDDPSLGVVLTF
jgi:hypothetical protein